MSEILCNACSKMIYQNLLLCPLCGVRLCDICFNMVGNSFVSKEGIVHDSTHPAMSFDSVEEKKLSPCDIYVSFNLKKAKRCIYKLECLFDTHKKESILSGVTLSSTNKKYIVYNSGVETEGSTYVCCKQVDFIPMLRELLDSLDYCEKTVDRVLKDLFPKIKDHKFIRFTCLKTAYKFTSNDGVIHLSGPAILWKGCIELELLGELKTMIKQFKEGLRGKYLLDDYSLSLTVLQV